MAHCLAFKSVAHNVTDALHLVADLSNLIRSSPKRLGLFLEIKDAVNPRAPGLKPLCPTVRTHAIDAVMKNYDTICQELEQIAEERHDDTGVKASGFAAKSEKFATYVGLKLSFLVFSATEQLSITLQTCGTNAQEALTAAKGAKLYLQQQHSETAFDLFWKSCEDESPMYEFVNNLFYQDQNQNNHPNGITQVLRLMFILLQKNRSGSSIMR